MVFIMWALLSLSALTAVAAAAQTASTPTKVTDCSKGDQCTLGCCSKSGFCGYGPDFCGAGSCNAALSANGTCSQKSECDAGGYPGYGDLWGPDYAERTYCPLNVCCSKFGFCGTTPDFCGSVVWPQPSCGGTSATKRTIGYYEGWSQDRPCGTLTPEQIPVAAYTHLNFAFAYIDPSSFAIAPMSANQVPLYSRFTALKKKKAGLQTWISIGGWAFNDPGATQETFGRLVLSTAAQSAFTKSLLAFLKQYGFDGVDLDWEYPVAPERGGRQTDFQDYVTFLASLRKSLGSYGLSITLPSSYWYMRNFDIVNLDKHVDFFNIMTYDVDGTWDATIPSIGPYVYAHTNATTIKDGLSLLWHNNIEPARVNLGIGFYARTYTLDNPSCKVAGCPFKAGGNPGSCTGVSGILSYDEMLQVIKNGANVVTDSKAMVKIATWGGNQWAGYEDPVTIRMKIGLANKLCMGGTFVWAVDLDTTYGLSSSLSGEPIGDLSPGGGGPVYWPLPSIWGDKPPKVVCAPPCTFILPPIPLATPRTITWPRITTDVLTSSAGRTLTMQTTISLPPFVISSVDIWPVTIASTDTFAVTFTPVQSIQPPPLTTNFPPGITLLPPTPIIGVPTSTTGGAACSPEATGGKPIQTPTPNSHPVKGCTKFHLTVSGDTCSSMENAYKITAQQFESWNPSVGAGCTKAIQVNVNYCVAGPPDHCLFPGIYHFPGGSISPVFPTTSHPVTIQPEPTVSISIEPPFPLISFSTTSSVGPTETDKPCKDCGDWDCGFFGCPPGVGPPGGGAGHRCGLFGCDGGCGILGCGGLCGLWGCGCKGCSINLPGGDFPDDSEPDDCDEPQPVTDCQVISRIYTPTGKTTATTSSTKVCVTSSACDGKGTTSTTTITSEGSTSTRTFTDFDYLATMAPSSDLLSISAALNASIIETFNAWFTGATIYHPPTSTKPSSKPTTTTTTASKPSTTSPPPKPTPNPDCVTADAFNGPEFVNGHGTEVTKEALSTLLTCMKAHAYGSDDGSFVVIDGNGNIPDFGSGAGVSWSWQNVELYMINTKKDKVCVDVFSVADRLPTDFEEGHILIDYATDDTWNVKLGIGECDPVYGCGNSYYATTAC